MKRVLIIDDEDDIREVAQVSLELVGGWEVLTASSGTEGIQRAQAEQPDAILLDVMMPGLDGPTTFERLQAEPSTRGIPVLLLTAKVQSAERARFDSLGVQGVLSKPFDPMKLASEVAEALGWPDRPAA
jgi:CheY-like chemotaxis protein